MNLKKIGNIAGAMLLVLLLLVTAFSITACEQKELPTEQGDASPPTETPTTQEPTENTPTENTPTENSPTEPPECEHAYDNACDADCNACGATREVSEHAYDHACDTDCNVCGATREVGEHAYDHACDTDCNVCGAIREVGEHAYDNACDADCNACGATREVGEHAYDHACDTDCNECGTTREVGEHAYDHACDTDCNVCGAIREVGEHNGTEVDYRPPTCTRDGVILGVVCTECEYIISGEEIIDALGHDEERHDGKAATCTEPGYKEYVTCTRCDYSTYESVPVIPHTEQVVWGRPSSCEEEGLTDGVVCAECGFVIEEQMTTPAAGHTRAKIHGTPATCTQSGTTDGYKCASCNKVLESQQYLPPTSHKEKIVPEVPPTCTSTGLSEGTACEYCGMEIVAQNKLAPIPHMEEIIPGTDATCTQGGVSDTRKCTVCQTVTQEGIPTEPLGHDEETVVGTAPTCTKAGTSDSKVCKRCQTVTEESQEVPKLGHDYPSTYSYDANYHYRRCNRCGVTETMRHSFSDDVCSKCGCESMTVINMTSHPAYRYSFDYVMLDGAVVSSASTNPNPSSITSVEILRDQAIQLYGWLGFTNGDKIADFGYYFDGMISDAVIESGFKQSAEQGVLDAGGEYRFTISGDTSKLSEGSHKITFVAYLTDGTVIVLKTLKFDVPKASTLIPDEEIVKAEKEELGDVDMTMTGLGNSQYKTPIGLKFIASSTGLTFSNGQFTISAANGLKISFSDYATRFSEEFNRYKIAYYSSAPLKAVVTYKEEGEAYSDTVYLEAGDNMLFNCLIPGYLDGEGATHIMSMDIQVLGDESSATFVLYNVTTDNVEVISNSVKYIENARYRLGIKLAWGGGISYLRDNYDGVSSVTNLINQADAGRLVQQSYYGTKDKTEYQPGTYNGTEWHYNPVQGGSLTNSPSRIIDLEIADGSVYIKAQPRDWAKSSLTPSYMENVYTVYENRIQVDNRFVDFAGYKTNPTRHQELPAFYTIGYLNTFKYYNGTSPWKNGALQVEANLAFWAGNSEQYFGLKAGNTETWCAWVNGATDYGVGLYVPNVDILYAGRHAYESDPDAISASSGACSYVAPLNSFKIVSYKPLEYSYLITTGSTSEIRSLFTQYKDFATNSSLTSAEFGYKSNRT